MVAPGKQYVSAATYAGHGGLRQMDGEFQPRPLEDPENVDTRRAKVGLPPLAEYIKLAREAYKKLSKSPPETEETRVPTDATVSSVTGNHLQGGKHG